MFYVMDNEKLAIFEDNKNIIESTLEFMPNLTNNHIIETNIVTTQELQQYPNKVIVGDVEIQIDAPDYETVTEEYEETVYETEFIEEEYLAEVFDEEGNPVYEKKEVPLLDMEGNPILDENGDQIIEIYEIPVYETKTRLVEKPIMIDVEEVILIPVYDDEGNFVEEKEEIVITQKQKTHIEIKSIEKTIQVGSHKETITTKGLILNPNFEAEEEVKKAEQIAKLSLTKREVFLALYQDKGITPEQIRSQITDQAALIEFDYAERYYRGNPLIDMLGVALGYTKEQLDYLFKQGEFLSEA